MRFVLEIIVIAALIALAWEKPMGERAGDLPWIGDKIAGVLKKPEHPQSAASHARPVTPAPTVSGAWMNDPNRRSPLDAPNKPLSVQPQSTSSASGAWMWDPRPLDPKKSPKPHQER